MKKIWSKLEGELTAKASAIIESLNPGADESEIEALEENIGQELPTDRPEKMKPLNQKPVRLFNYNWLRFSFRKETVKS